MRRVTLSYKMVNEHICSNFLPSLVKGGMSVSVLRCAPVGPRFGHSLVRIQGPHELCETELADIKDRVGEWCSVEISKTAPGDYIAMVSNHDCAVCHLITGSRCFLESCSLKEDGTITWNLLGPDADCVRRLVGELNDSGRKVTVHSTREQESCNALTFRQKQALLLAFEEGFFDIPQRTTLNDMAPRVKCSKSTLNVMLRRAERKIMAEYIARS
jgi:HTH-type transcriptional regulator, dimethyl sulfoxide reductase transcription regulator